MSSPQIEAEVRRLATLVESLLKQRSPGSTPGEGRIRVGVRAIEKKLGWSAGVLGRLLRGKTEFRIRSLLEILEALDLTPEEFFSLAYQLQPTSRDSSRELLDLVQARGKRGALPRDEASITDDELDERVLASLHRLKIAPPKEGGAES